MYTSQSHGPNYIYDIAEKICLVSLEVYSPVCGMSIVNCI